MKKFFTLFALLFFGCIGANAQFDSEALSFSGGLDLSLPLGNLSNVYGVGFGLNANAHYPINENIEALVTLGFDRFGAKEDISGSSSPVKYSFTAVNIQAGARYYFSSVGEGAFAQGLLGIHPVTSKVDYPEDLENELSYFGFNFFEDISSSTTVFGLNIGGGYALESFEVKASFQLLADSFGSGNIFKLGGAYKF